MSVNVYDPVEVATRVDQLARELEDRATTIEGHVDRYQGRGETLRWASKKFDEYFKKQFAGFGDNWCMPVVDAAAERMSVLGFRAHGEDFKIDQQLQRDWLGSNSDLGSSEAFTMQMAAGRAFSLVHPADSPDKAPSVTWEHPQTAIVDTDPVTGIDRDGLVMWRDDQWDYATYYTPTHFVKLKRHNGKQRFEDKSRMNAQGGWILKDDEEIFTEHRLGEVPLTEIRNKTLLDEEPLSDIAGVAALQDAVNLVWAYLMNALDQASMPARVAVNADVPQVPILDKDGQIAGYQDVELDELIKEKIIFLPGQDARIEEWTAANLEAFSKVISQIVEHIAAQTRTPPHYLVAKMINTAAESLNIAEAGLVSKVKERILYASKGIKKTFRLMAAARGASAERIEVLRAGTIIWDNIQYRSEAQMADVGTKLKSAGFPTEYVVEKLVTDPVQVARVMKMVERERTMDPFIAAEERMRQGVA
ncbi:phage portal protein [Glutamicibacter sp.]|uniref:phage portal protein n=1 Tax=Glutamicibacter sp. TaxID=1931995 RepID=UPI0028BD389F|nr:phage portal protein [Glutamicibacter sp.]